MDPAGAGAMGVHLGMPVQDVDGPQPRPELGVGEEADGPFLDTTVGMLWRALVLWVAVLAGMAVVAYSSRFWGSGPSWPRADGRSAGRGAREASATGGRSSGRWT